MSNKTERFEEPAKLLEQRAKWLEVHHSKPDDAANHREAAALLRQEGLSAATPPDVEQMAEEVLSKFNEMAEKILSLHDTFLETFDLNKEGGKQDEQDSYLKLAIIAGLKDAYQAGQSAVQDATLYTLEDMRKCWNYAGDFFEEHSDEDGSLHMNFDQFLETIKPQDATPQEWEFKYFPNHGDEDGRGCFTICYSGKDEYGDDDYDDAVLVAVDDTEEGAKEACNRLNNILQSQLSTLRSELAAAQEENKRLRETVINGLRDIKRAAQVNIDEDDVFNAAETMGDALEKSFILTDALLSAITAPESGEQTK